MRRLKQGYKDFDGAHDPEHDLSEDFEGVGFVLQSADDLPVRLSLLHVVYDQVCQARSPLEVLIGACITHGSRLGELHERFKWRERMESMASLLEMVLQQVERAREK